MGGPIRGHHAPMQVICWSLTGISDGGQCNLMGLDRKKTENVEPQMLLARLGPFFETAERMADDAANRSKPGGIQVSYVGGDH
eukprot:3859751-Pyramimonas_sp.AAC.1